MPVPNESDTLKRGYFMHEVKIFDSFGKLKKVISIKALNARDEQQIENPLIFSKNKRFGRLGRKRVKSQEISRIPSN